MKIAADPENRMQFLIAERNRKMAVRSVPFLRHYPSTKQVNARAPKHRPLEHLEFVDLAFRLTIAPGSQHGMAHGRDILSQGSDKPPHAINTAFPCVVQPVARRSG
jgi:hypothetical protein